MALTVDLFTLNDLTKVVNEHLSTTFKADPQIP